MADVQEPDITPEDFDGEQEKPEKETPKAESSTAKEDAKAESKEKPEAKGKEETKDIPEVPDVPTKGEEAKPDEADKPEGEVEAPEDKPEGEEKPLGPKGLQRNQRLANENRELRQEIERLTSETYAPQTVQELSEIVNPETGEPYTIAQAADIAFDQKMRMRDHVDRATNTQSLLGAEAYEILHELPMFNPDSKEYDEELATLASDTLENNLIRDPNIPEIDPNTGKPTGLGMIIDFKQSPKQIYATLARASGISATKGQIKGQQATEKQLANVDANSSSAPPSKPKDPLADLWADPL